MLFSLNLQCKSEETGDRQDATAAVGRSGGVFYPPPINRPFTVNIACFSNLPQTTRGMNLSAEAQLPGSLLLLSPPAPSSCAQRMDPREGRAKTCAFFPDK